MKLRFNKLFFIFIVILFQSEYVIADKQPDDNIKIGVIASLAPEGAFWSSSANLGLQEAQREINEKGGINGRKLELIFEDDRFDPKKTILAYHKLTKVNKVDLIIGPQFEQTLTPVIPIANREKRLLITTITSTPISKDKNPWVIHSVPSDRLAAKCLAETIIKDNRSKILFIIPEEAYSQTFSGFLKEFIPNTSVNTINYLPEGVDFNSLLLKVKNIQPDALVLFFVTPESAIEVYKKMDVLNIKIPVYSNEVLHNSAELLKAVGNEAIGTSYCTVPFDKTEERFKKLLMRLPQEPALPLYTFIAYDTLNWIAEEIRKYGTDNTELQKNLSKLSFSGIFTNYRFDEFGDLAFADFSKFQITKEGFVLKKDE